MINNLSELIEKEDQEPLFEALKNWSQSTFQYGLKEDQKIRMGIQAYCLILLQSEQKKAALHIMRQSFYYYKDKNYQKPEFNALAQSLFATALQSDCATATEVFCAIFDPYTQCAPSHVSAHETKIHLGSFLAAAISENIYLSKQEIIKEYEQWDLYITEFSEILYGHAVKNNHVASLYALIELEKLTKPLAMYGVCRRLGHRLKDLDVFAKVSKEAVGISFEDFLNFVTTPAEKLPKVWQVNRSSAGHSFFKYHNQNPEAERFNKDSHEDSIRRMNDIFDFFKPDGYPSKYHSTFQKLIKCFTPEECPELHALVQKVELTLHFPDSAPPVSRIRF